MKLPGFSAEAAFDAERTPAAEEESTGGRKSSPRRIAVPGLDRDIGLGDVIKRATSSVGIAPCGGCQQRARTLNSWIVFTGRHG
ncbi:MAG TPA: hypothetical protein VKE70_04040 [Candidatus Solibacter sp.]|nr:hypothetical protein [Candidatus Solibacter sp.]